jgi:hypothetical protein
MGGISTLNCGRAWRKNAGEIPAFGGAGLKQRRRPPVAKSLRAGRMPMLVASLENGKNMNTANTEEKRRTPRLMRSRLECNHMGMQRCGALITQALRIVVGCGMPTILRSGRLRVAVYLNDHRPAQVHMIGRGCEAVCNLNCAAGPVRLRENYGFTRAESPRIAKSLTKHLAALCRAWERIHDIS